MSAQEQQQFAKDGGLVELRFATIDDMKLLFEWQCDERSRKFARNSEAPSWDVHVAWVVKYLASNGKLFIIKHNGEEAGLLRLDPLVSGDYEISLVIAPKYYRVGPAVPALHLARLTIPEGSFYAEVLEGNEASHRMLLQAGYILQSQGRFVLRPLITKLTESEFLDILIQIRPQATLSWLQVPVQDTSLDSLDLMEFRSALEVKLSRGISDALWFESVTLGDLLKGL